MNKISIFLKSIGMSVALLMVFTGQAHEKEGAHDDYDVPEPQMEPGSRNGEPVVKAGKIERVWLQEISSWTSVETFWKFYAKRSSGKYWGQSTEYPTYADVNELDTFMVELPTGVCLMEFWHSRWRRANDVRRWDPAFNEHSACPDVFK